MSDSILMAIHRHPGLQAMHEKACASGIANTRRFNNNSNLIISTSGLLRSPFLILKLLLPNTTLENLMMAIFLVDQGCHQDRILKRILNSDQHSHWTAFAVLGMFNTPETRELLRRNLEGRRGFIANLF